MDLNTVIARVLETPAREARKMIAVVGAPGAGKSTISAPLMAGLAKAGARAAVIPMDGYHLDDRILGPRGDLPRKGAPHTYDVGGFRAMIDRVARGDTVYIPVFDRSREIAIAGAEEIGADIDTVVVEGNYLLLQDGDWAGIKDRWDISLFLDVPEEVLEHRLMARWRDLGMSEDQARTKVAGNDLINMRTVLDRSAPADITVPNGG
ncbi:nucleoside/nucleotide kinase family protein [Rhodovulum sp. FJ3]|uniref:nucleoside/nucleotide kinase family protein n=1 Tax=Rhodovulum sp. FJ3 TaxID=3079053 RepID=UPI00293DBC15|nr:nucleoside/nucleotide kinase family protein [Rhodovulum sp. FJ3]MDV4167435.1 nucleoside/nucleotide kinase family protein [Rhodovulum sp. FJ3]